VPCSGNRIARWLAVQYMYLIASAATTHGEHSACEYMYFITRTGNTVHAAHFIFLNCGVS
jgi:hypothetical protein